MRTFRLLSLTTLAALTTMALVGASQAMAEGSTSLCKVDQRPCETKNLISHIHEETLDGNPAMLLSDPTIECKILFLGDANPTLGNPLLITGKFSYINCNSACSIEEINGPATVKVLRLGTELADLTSKGEFKMTCLFGFIKCVHNHTGLVGHSLGPLTSAEPNGEVRLEEQTLTRVSGSCPELTKLDILLTQLTATYLSS